MKTKSIYIVAGGTGGHINAALSVGDEFSSDYTVKYISGQRFLDKKLFSGMDITHIKSQPLRTKNPLKLIANVFKNFISFLSLWFKFLMDRPVLVIGAGGYVCGPSLMAAKLLLIPIFIIEQNAVMGVTNKILSKFSDLIFTNFENTKGLENSSKNKVVGNPIRKTIQYVAPPETEALNILIFGGSLGATQINEVVKNVIQRKFLRELNIVHQIGKGNESSDYHPSSQVNYEQLEYIDDMQSRYAKSHLIIARSGASTVSELRVVKRPTIIIPFPFATDNHQYFNALNLKEEGLFPVEILDYNKSVDELANQVYDSINNFKPSESKIIQKDIPPAAALIKSEIENYVRN